MHNERSLSAHDPDRQQGRNFPQPSKGCAWTENDGRSTIRRSGIEQPQNNADGEIRQDKPFELTISACVKGDGVQTEMSHSGRPGDSREVESLSVSMAARAMAFMYDASLVGGRREDTPAGRALFFTAMQPAIMNAFLGITASWQFRKSQKAEAEKIPA